MAPVTRRRAKADSSILSEVDSTPAQSQQSTPKAKPAQKLRRKAADTAVDSSKAETPKPNKKLAVRTRIEEDADGDHRHTHIEATLVDAESNEHTARDGSVADSNAEEESDGSAPEPTSASRQLYEEAKLASQSTEPEGDKGAPTPSAAPKGKHVVFGDDDDVEKFVTKAAKAQAARVETAEDEEEESDDDAAPEAVSTSAAAKASQKAEQAAVEAAEKHAATQKRKRQERDALFKEQATERKRTEAETKASTTRQRISKRDLPDELPAEFLEDSSDEEDGADRLQRLKKKRKLFEAEQTAAAELQASKKIKFDEIAEIADKAETEAIRHRVKPRDVALGSTVYRVLAQQGDTRLAPKMHKNSRTVKEDLLRRKREGVTVNKKKGFFVRK